MSEIRDVVVIGGGLVGGLTTLLLTQGGVKVTVLDAAPVLDEQQVVHTLNPRVLALSQATIHLLKITGVWELISRYMPYSGMQVWNKNGYGEIEFGQPSETAPFAEQALGAMVEPSLLNLAIQKKMQDVVHEYRTQVKVERIESYPKDQWGIWLANGEFIQTHLIVGADGANSFVRDQAFIELDILDYRQAAISCAVKTTQPHQHVARQIFLPTGPLAFLPMASLNAEENGLWQSIVWTLPEDYAEEYSLLSDDQFKTLLTQQSQHMLGEVVEVRSRAQFPLKARSAQQYVKAGLALVGDAAHVIHPLAGQGVNIGCLDAAVLCDVLLHDLKRGVWAHSQTLNRYQHLRKGENAAMMHSMSAIGWLESREFMPLVFARNFGVRQVNEHQILKNLFLQHASGKNSLHQTQYAF